MASRTGVPARLLKCGCGRSRHSRSLLAGPQSARVRASAAASRSARRRPRRNPRRRRRSGAVACLERPPLRLHLCRRSSPLRHLRHCLPRWPLAVHSHPMARPAPTRLMTAVAVVREALMRWRRRFRQRQQSPRQRSLRARRRGARTRRGPPCLARARRTPGSRVAADDGAARDVSPVSR